LRRFAFLWDARRRLSRDSKRADNGEQELSPGKLGQSYVYLSTRGRVTSKTLDSQMATERLCEPSVKPAPMAQLDIPYATDLGLTYLAMSHDAGFSHGLSGAQPYFDIIRRAIIHRMTVLYALPSSAGRLFEDTLVPARTRRVVEHIDANLSRDLRLAELSEIAGSSRAHFARAFRNVTGVSAHAFVLQRRLAEALRLVRQRRMPVKEIAAQCGFADRTHLSRAFKTYFGASPSTIFHDP
jgi:AraC family transcriptional regulator